MNNKIPNVCICIPTYNAELTIADSLTSIINQTYSNIIIKVIDNASTDRTIEIIKSFNDKRITVYRNKINVGPEENFNNCIKYSTSSYTAIFHADDVYHKNIILEQVNFLNKNKNVGAVFTAANLINIDSKRIGKILIPKQILKLGSVVNFIDLFKIILKKSNFIVCPSAMVRTHIYSNEIKIWRFKLFMSSSDLDVWLRISEKYLLGFINKRLINYRISNIQGSAKNRLNTSRSDFFLVTKYYMKKYNYLINNTDCINHQELLLRDDILRFSNQLLANKIFASKKLIYSIISRQWTKILFNSYRGFLLVIYNFVIILIYKLRLIFLLKYLSSFTVRIFS